MKHDCREKEEYKSNPDIDNNRTKYNIYIVYRENYKKYYNEKIAPYREQHEEEMKHVRKSRQRTFMEQLNSGNFSILEKHVFEATRGYFDNKPKEELVKRANCCMQFLYDELGYDKDLVINSVIHLDEANAHLHVSYLPLVKKYDNRKKRECWTLSKQENIKGREHLKYLQDKHYEVMKANGFELLRGVRGSNRKNLSVQKFKQSQDLLQKATNKGQNLKQQSEIIHTTVENLKPTRINKNQYLIYEEEKGKMIFYIKSVEENMENIIQLQEFNILFDGTQEEIKQAHNQVKEIKKENTKLESKVGRLENKVNYQKVQIKEREQEIKQLQHENSKLHDIVYFWQERFRQLKKFLSKKLFDWLEKEEKYIEVVEDLHQADILDYEDIEEIKTEEKGIER